MSLLSSRYTVLGVEGDVLKGCGLVYRCQGMLMNIVINYACKPVYDRSPEAQILVYINKNVAITSLVAM